ncbi:hypothetical protein GCM10009665_45070 [Kitasatospora nipponensis]|uniref:Uncharacterized protein n=1 Tax=Kitasatospora nipponensis TaxID=258049 RepID=A0ABP4H6W1_9ACTN
MRHITLAMLAHAFLAAMATAAASKGAAETVRTLVDLTVAEIRRLLAAGRSPTRFRHGARPALTP